MAADSSLLLRHEFKLEFQIVLQSQSPSRNRKGFDAIVRLTNGEFARDPHRRYHAGHAGVEQMVALNPMKGELPHHVSLKQAISYVLNSYGFARERRSRKAFYFQDL